MLEQPLRDEQIHRSSRISFLWKTTRDLSLPVPLETARARLESAFASSGEGRLDGDNLEYQYAELYSRSNLYFRINGHLSAAPGGSRLRLTLRSKRLLKSFYPILIGVLGFPIFFALIDKLHGRNLLILAISSGVITSLIFGSLFFVLILRRWMAANRVAERLLNIVSDPPPN